MSKVESVKSEVILIRARKNCFSPVKIWGKAEKNCGFLWHRLSDTFHYYLGIKHSTRNTDTAPATELGSTDKTATLKYV